MTERNDTWMRLWDQVPAEHRWIFEQTNEHYNAAFGSMLKVVLQSLESIETKVDAQANDRKFIADHLTSLHSEIDALRKDVHGRLVKLERRMDTSEGERSKILQAIATIQEWIDRQPTPEQSEADRALLRNLSERVDANERARQASG